MSNSASLFILRWNRPIAPMYTDLQSVWEIQACHYSVRESSSFISSLASRVIPIVLTGSGNINLYNMGYNYNNGGWSEWSLWLCAPRTEYWRFYQDWSNLVVSLGHLIPALHLTYAGNRGERSTFYTYFCATSHGHLKCTCNTIHSRTIELIVGQQEWPSELYWDSMRAFRYLYSLAGHLECL